MTQQTIAARIRKRAYEVPNDRVCWHVSSDGSESTLTWDELDKRSSQIAGSFSIRGVRLGDRVGLSLRNSSAFTLATFACWKLGAIPVPLRWDVPEWELEKVKAVIDPKVFLDQESIDWITATEADPVPDLPDALSPSSFGICSSGSTGTPKVILRAQPSVFHELFAKPFITAWHQVPEPQTILVLAPMYHSTGFSCLNNLLGGDRLVVMERFDAALALELIERHRITTFTATPTMLQRIADFPGVDTRDLTSIEWILQGAAPMPASLVHRWSKLIGPTKILMAYGMTEGLGITALRGDEWMTHQGSVGRPFRDTEICVLDPDLQSTPPGEIGEIYLRSPMYDGYQYLGGAPKLRGTSDGFQTAGDLGYLDGDGYLYLVDRRVDLIISGGANIYPAEVENALIDHPRIADIVVIGLNDAQWGRRVHAIVEPAVGGPVPTAADVIAYAKSRLAPYKVPKSVEFVDTMPRSEATKINRNALIAARGG